MMIRPVLALVLMLLSVWTVTAQTTAVQAKLEAIKADAKAALDRNAKLRPKSQLPIWVTDAMTRILTNATAASAALAEPQIIIGPPQPLPPKPGGGGGLTCDATAANLTRATVQTFLTAATTAGSSGDPYVYCLPAGSETWTSQVSWTAPAYTVLKGAGDLNVVGSDGATTITDGYSSGGPVLYIVTSATGSFRFAGIKFTGGTLTGTNYKYEGVMQVAGDTQQLRIDHVTIDTRDYVNAFSVNGIKIRGCIDGVIDSSVFENNNAFVVHRNGCDVGGEGDLTWSEATGFGGSDFLFFEDNVVNPVDQYGAVNDCFHAGKWVIRYNVSNGAGVQTHPTGGSGRARGCRASELYGNTFNAPPTGEQFNAFFLSSGPSMIWGNTVAASEYSNFITLHSMRRDNSTYSQTATPDGWGWCGTSQSGTGSNWDGNTNVTTGYPCLDQPGRGVGDLLANNFPTAQNTDTGKISWPDQALEPVYVWLSPWAKWSGGWFVAAYEEEVLVENQDYYSDANNETGAAITFNGTVGVGSGVRASRPATCTTGVVYWSTDQGGNWNTTNGSANDGTLDKCTATNTWTNGVYTPYTYPHPGRS